MAQKIEHREALIFPLKESKPRLPSPWFLGPQADLLLVCGGLAWLAIAIHYTLGRPADFLPGFATAQLIASILSADTHVGATSLRLWLLPKSENLNRKYGLLLPLTLFPVLLAGFFVTGVAGWLVKIHLIWNVYHYFAQAYGFVLIYCQKQNFPLSPSSRKLLKWTFYSASLAVGLKMLSFFGHSHTITFKVPIPQWPNLPSFFGEAGFVAWGGIFVVTVVSILKDMKMNAKLFPLPALALSFSVFAFLLMGRSFSSVAWIYIPALFHGSQYVTISLVSYLNQKDRDAGNEKSQNRSSIVAALPFFFGALLVGAILYRGLPLLCKALSLSTFEVTATLIVVINFHHFLTDAAIWRLRKPNIRENTIA